MLLHSTTILRGRNFLDHVRRTCRITSTATQYLFVVWIRNSREYIWLLCGIRSMCLSMLCLHYDYCCIQQLSWVRKQYTSAHHIWLKANLWGPSFLGYVRRTCRITSIATQHLFVVWIRNSREYIWLLCGIRSMCLSMLCLLYDYCCTQQLSWVRKAID